MEGLPGWVVGQMPGPPPRQHKHERQYTPSTHSVILTRRIWNDDDDGRPNDIRGPWGPKISWHLSYGWGKTPKKPHPGNLSRPGIEPGPAAWQARMLSLAPQRWTTSFITRYIMLIFIILFSISIFIHIGPITICHIFSFYLLFVPNRSGVMYLFKYSLFFHFLILLRHLLDSSYNIDIIRMQVFSISISSIISIHLFIHSLHIGHRQQSNTFILQNMCLKSLWLKFSFRYSCIFIYRPIN